ncbi:TRAP transporter fused permease subunit [Dehalococcoidia bacterium]|nr:TRAP transporter fused permease subunit [Dehalococcoidia bacterium]
MRDLSGGWKWFASLLVAGWAGFLLYTALTIAMHPLFQGAISLTFGLSLVFLHYPLDKKRLATRATSLRDSILWGTNSSPSWLDIVLAIAAVIPCIYIMLEWEEIAWAVGRWETHQLVLGGILVVMLLEGSRRSLGKAIPLVVLFFLAYALLGQFVPGFFGHPGFAPSVVLYQLYLMTEGIWGLLTDMTSRIIALFIIFGPVLFATGVGKGFMDLARFFGGRIQGGAGQIAVISSASFGTLSGSSVANVATTGALTIPTMKRLGYKRELAGAIEATASAGGQVMPPIMGAGAFVMAEFLGIPYLSVVVAAIIPAIIYFTGVGSGVYIQAKKYGLGKLPPELMPKAKEVFSPRQLMVLFIPIGLLVYLLVQLLPPQLAAAWALIAAMSVFLLTGGSLSYKGLWERIKTLASAYYTAVATTLAWLMVMMSCVQIAVSLIGLTGFGVKISEVIMSVAGVNILLALILTMVCALILGMGMTTTAAYVIGAAVLGPALIGLGMDPLAGHLFIFYFAILSALTPPVCIAVFTATAISGGSWLRLAVISMILGIGGYIIPYFFIFEPALLMNGDPLIILLHTLTALAGVFFLAAGMLGYWIKPVSTLERLILIAGGLALMHPGLLTDGIGLALIVGGWFSQRYMPSIPVIGRRPASLPASQGEPIYENTEM